MIDTDEGSALVRSEDKYRRVCWKLIHHHAYSTRPLLTPSTRNGRNIEIEVERWL
jgi:hypothetical protein